MTPPPTWWGGSWRRLAPPANESGGNHAVLIAARRWRNAWGGITPFNGFLYFLPRAVRAPSRAIPLLELTTPVRLSRAPACRPAAAGRGCAPGRLGCTATPRDLDGGSGQEPGVGSAVRRQGGLRSRHAGAEEGDPAQRARPPGRQARARLREFRLVFWWFGGLQTRRDAVSQFDHLYRRQLLTLYRAPESPAPRGELTACQSQPGNGSPEHGRSHAPRLPAG